MNSNFLLRNYGRGFHCNGDLKIEKRGPGNPQSFKLENQKDDGGVIFELTEENIEDYVVDSTKPIVVEVSVTNMPPAVQQASEVLERIIKSYKGAIRLGRVNLEKQQNLAQYFKVTHVPTYFVILQGKILGRPLVGPQSETTFRKYISVCFEEQFSATVNQMLTNADKFLENGDIPQAAQIYSQILSQQTFVFVHAQALAGLILCALKEKNLETAQGLTETLKSSYPESLEQPRVKQALSQVELESIQGTSDVDVEALKNKIKENPKDLQSRYELGLYYQKRGQYQNAIDENLNIIKIDKEWNDRAAKAMLIKIFDSLGPEHPTTLAGRRRLNNIWFA
jgi:putative thioredoxin